MRAWFVVGSLQILAVRAMISTSAFGLFDSKASVFSTLCSDGEELHACVPWRVPPADILSVGTKSRCQQRVAFAVFKAMFGEDVCRSSFSLPSTQCNFQTLARNG